MTVKPAYSPFSPTDHSAWSMTNPLSTAILGLRLPARHRPSGPTPPTGLACAHLGRSDLDLLTLAADRVNPGHPFRMKHHPHVGPGAGIAVDLCAAQGQWPPGRRPERASGRSFTPIV
jgi:hypothetical protein